MDATVPLDGRDLRLGGRWTRPQRVKNALIRAALHALVAVADRLPAAVLLWAGGVLGRTAWRVLGAARRRAREDLALVVAPEQVARVARASFENAGRNLARCLLARRATVRGTDHVWIDPESRVAFDAALAEGRGVVFVSAHVGPFEWVAAAIAELGHPASIVVRESYDPGLDPLVDAHRTARGLEVIHRGDRGAALRTLRALRAGRAVGVLPDLGARVPSVEVEFLGARRALPLGPARLARAAGCPLLIGVLEPSAAAPAPFRLRIERLSDAGDGDARMTRRVMSAIEAAIARAPEQWLWMAAPRRLQKNRRGL